MRRHLTPQETPETLAATAAAYGQVIRRKYGPLIDWRALQSLLEDRECARYQCDVRFDADLLLPGEFGHTRPRGLRPEEGFTIYVHPQFADRPAVLPHIVLHQLCTVNFGATASAEHAEMLGSTALGLSPEAYFRQLCELADEVGGDDLC